MADPRYSYQFTADAPPLAFPVSQGYAPAVDYVPPTLPELELNQLLNGQPVGISPFGPRYVEPSPILEDGDISGYGGVPSAEELAFAVGGPGGAYAAYRAGQAVRGMYDDAIAAERYAAQGSQRVRPGSTYQAGDWYKWVTPPLAQEYLQGSATQGVAAQPALPVGASRAALPPGADPLALPPRPTFETTKDRILYDFHNAALRERYSPGRAAYYRPSPGALRDEYVPFEAAREKLIAQGNLNRTPHSAPAEFQPIPQSMADRYRVLNELWANGTITPAQDAERSAIWDIYRNRENDYRKSIQLTPEEEAAWAKNASTEMTKDAMRGNSSSKRRLGPQGKRAIERLGRLAKGSGSTAMGLAGFTGIISQLIKPDPFDPIGNYIMRSNPEAYPEQVKQYNEAVSNVWY